MARSLTSGIARSLAGTRRVTHMGDGWGSIALPGDSWSGIGSKGAGCSWSTGVGRSDGAVAGSWSQILSGWSCHRSGVAGMGGRGVGSLGYSWSGVGSMGYSWSGVGSVGNSWSGVGGTSGAVATMRCR